MVRRIRQGLMLVVALVLFAAAQTAVQQTPEYTPEQLQLMRDVQEHIEWSYLALP